MLKSEIREKSKAKSIFKGCFDKHFKSNEKKMKILSQHNSNPYMVGFLIADAECQAIKNQLLKKSKKKILQKKKNKSAATHETDNPHKEELTESEQKILTDYIEYNKPVRIQNMTPALTSRLYAFFKYPNSPDSKKFQIAQHLRQTAFKYKKCFDKRLSNHGRKK